jgi:pyruvyltransferase
MNGKGKRHFGNALGVFVRPIMRFFHAIETQGHLPLFWRDEGNWGDEVNPLLASLLSEKPVLRSELYSRAFMAVGSTLDMANRRTRVWGSGLLDSESLPREAPLSIHAVRGPLTRERLLAASIPCPDTYGDPVLLLPRFYNPHTRRKFRVGIVPHAADKASLWLEPFRALPDVVVLDVAGDLLYFVRSLKACDVILSSALHGLVLADAYGIPRRWIKLSDGVPGGDFKFRDYLLSTGEEAPKPLVITPETTLAEAAAQARMATALPNLARLALSCPFLSEKLRREIVTGMNTSGELPQTLHSSVRASVE